MNSPITISFRFYGSLSDLLTSPLKNRTFLHTVKGNPSIKDTIESLGIPHPEVGKMLVNKRPVTFAYQLEDGDKIAVYPHVVIKKRNPKFILDVHLGKLVRHLRLLGFDALYSSAYSDEEIVQIAEAEKRIILTRDVCLLKNKIVTTAYWVRSIIPATQIREVIRKFALVSQIKPFRRCLDCNGRIKPVAKTKIEADLPPKVRLYYDKFYFCSACQKIYWQGSHYVKLDKLVKRIKNARS